MKKKNIFIFVTFILGLLAVVGIFFYRTIYKKWEFSDRQYEFNMSNLSYFIDEKLHYDVDGKIPELVVTASARLKNISIEPFIVKGEIARCKVYRGDQLTNYYISTQLPIEKGLRPGEELSFVVPIEIRGQDYDSSGNKTYPSMGLRVKSCEVILTTNNSNITHLNALTSNPVDADIEPKIIIFE